MAERLYTDHPRLYDAIQSDWDYDRDVAFVRGALERYGSGGRRLLEVGCGTGEHTRRFVADGFDVTAVDTHAEMLAVAREKCTATFRRETFPALAVEGRYDVVVALRGVVNHLPPADLSPALETLSDRLADGGVLVFDNSPLPPDGNHPAIDVGSTPRGDYGRIAQLCPRDDGRLDWHSIVFRPDGEFFVDTRPMTPFEDERIADALEELGLSVDTHDGFGPGDDRTVFVAAA